jgi:galactose mutarotase-like enzyme
MLTNLGGDAGGRELFGELSDGRPVHRYTLGSSEGILLRVIDYGAAVQELWVPDAEGRRANVVLGASDPAGYELEPSDYYGAVIGRFANRISGARLPIGDTQHQLLANDGTNTLHGGPDGFHRRLWTVLHADRDRIDLRLRSPDGDQGFPGALDVAASYRVGPDEVRIDLSATTTATTAVGLTQHSHFNLAGESSGSIGDHTLQLHADAFTPVRADLTPLGPFRDVAGTALDFRLPRTLDSARLATSRQVRLARGVDHNFVLSSPTEGAAAVLRDPRSGRVLELFTDQPGLQVYTGNFFDGSHVGTGGVAYRCAAGVALEPQLFPDTPHHEGEAGWPSAVLNPGDLYRAGIRWRFSADQRQ